MNVHAKLCRGLLRLSIFSLFLLPINLADTWAQGPQADGVEEKADTSEFDDFDFENIPVEGEERRTTRTVDVNAQVRLRTEIDRRAPGPGGENEATDRHFLRTRLTVSISPFEGVDGMVQAQDSRTFGSSGSTIASIDPNALDIHQAWFEIDDFLMENLSARVGRQELAYANERLVGAVGWHNRGRTFDGLRLRSQNSWGTVDLFGARTDNGERVSANLEGTKHLFGAWGALSPSDGHTVDLFVLYDNDNTKSTVGEDTAVDAHNRGTYGVRWLGVISSLTLEVEGAFQNGDMVMVGGSLDTLGSIAAYMASVRGSIKVGALDIGLLFTLLSGDDDPLDDESNTFNTLFATNHKFYGYMDYFPGNSGRAGLQDIAILLGLKPGKSTSLALDGHYLAPAIDGDPFGIELDLTLKHAYNRAVSFVFGGSVMIPENGLAGLPGEENGYWGYVMATVNL